MMKNALPVKRLKKSLEEAYIHLKRLLYAREKIRSFFPLKVDDINNLDEELIGHIEGLHWAAYFPGASGSIAGRL